MSGTYTGAATAQVTTPVNLQLSAIQRAEQILRERQQRLAEQKAKIEAARKKTQEEQEKLKKTKKLEEAPTPIVATAKVVETTTVTVPLAVPAPQEQSNKRARTEDGAVAIGAQPTFQTPPVNEELMNKIVQMDLAIRENQKLTEKILDLFQKLAATIAFGPEDSLEVEASS